MDAAWGWYRATLRCSRHCGAHGSLVERLVGCAIYEEAWRQSANWAADGRTTAELLTIALQDVQVIHAATPPFTQNLRTDYLQLTNTIAGLQERAPGFAIRGDSSSESELSDAETIQSTLDLRYRRFEPNWSLRVAKLIYANWLPIYDQPRAARPPRSARVPHLFLSKAMPEGVHSSVSTEQIERAFDKTILCKLLLPAVDLVDREVCRDEMRRGFLLVTLALQRYQRWKGWFPDSLLELLGDDLHEIPADPFETNAQLHYRLAEGTAIVWSGPIESARIGRSIDQSIEVRLPTKPP
jgi:hypothetical protein